MTDNLEKLQRIYKTASAVVPYSGVPLEGQTRMIQSLRANPEGNGAWNPGTEAIGPYTSTATTTLIAALLGAAAKNPAAGGVAGAGAGILGNIGGRVAAALAPVRSEKAQLEHDAKWGPGFANLFIPGASTYNSAQAMYRRRADQASAINRMLGH